MARISLTFCAFFFSLFFCPLFHLLQSFICHSFNFHIHHICHQSACPPLGVLQLLPPPVSMPLQLQSLQDTNEVKSHELNNVAVHQVGHVPSPPLHEAYCHLPICCHHCHPL